MKIHLPLPILSEKKALHSFGTIKKYFGLERKLNRTGEVHAHRGIFNAMTVAAFRCGVDVMDTHNALMVLMNQIVIQEVRYPLLLWNEHG